MKLQKQPARSVPTTELITHPEYFLLKDRPTLLVSFARSGNSPESIAAVDVVNGYCTNVYHLFITCNEKGELNKIPASPNVYKIILPPETNDDGLAMTSSFSSMMLAFILVAKINEISQEKMKVTRLSFWIRKILADYEESIERMAQTDFRRAVFLGSGPLRGTAEESHLKLQELTDGEVICTFNSFLGLRHGPRVAINGETLLVYLFSDSEHTRRYEYDLVQQVSAGTKPLLTVAVSHRPVDIKGVKFDLEICFGSMDDPEADIEYLCIAEVLLAQLLGFYKSKQLGLNPDNPSKSGTISRVVEGVVIYPFNF
jgi:tagatose-6-phosphate ketose/aldose isomerase